MLLIDFLEKNNIKFTNHNGCSYKNKTLLNPCIDPIFFERHDINSCKTKNDEITKFTHVNIDLSNVSIFKTKKNHFNIGDSNIYDAFFEEINKSQTPSFEDDEYTYFFVKTNVKLYDIYMSKYDTVYTHSILCKNNLIVSNAECNIFEYEFDVKDERILCFEIKNNTIVDVKHKSYFSNNSNLYIPIHTNIIESIPDLSCYEYTSNSVIINDCKIHYHKKNCFFLKEERNQLLKASDILTFSDYQKDKGLNEIDVINYRKYLRDVTEGPTLFRYTYLPTSVEDYVQFSNLFYSL